MLRRTQPDLKRPIKVPIRKIPPLSTIVVLNFLTSKHLVSVSHCYYFHHHLHLHLGICLDTTHQASNCIPILLWVAIWNLNRHAYRKNLDYLMQYILSIVPYVISIALVLASVVLWVSEQNEGVQLVLRVLTRSPIVISISKWLKTKDWSDPTMPKFP